MSAVVCKTKWKGSPLLLRHSPQASVISVHHIMEATLSCLLGTDWCLALLSTRCRGPGDRLIIIPPLSYLWRLTTSLLWVLKISKSFYEFHCPLFGLQQSPHMCAAHGIFCSSPVLPTVFPWMLIKAKGKEWEGCCGLSLPLVPGDSKLSYQPLSVFINSLRIWLLSFVPAMAVSPFFCCVTRDEALIEYFCSEAT